MGDSRIYRLRQGIFEQLTEDHSMAQLFIQMGYLTPEKVANHPLRYVMSQAVGQGQNSLRYLSRYVFRVAISNNRIKSIENDVIKFLYKDRGKKKWKMMALDAMAFIRRFLQHVLPKGFMKIRHYGFLNANSAISIEKDQLRQVRKDLDDQLERLSGRVAFHVA